MRQSARDRVNAAIDDHVSNLGLTLRQIEKRDRPTIADHFTDEGLTLAQKRRREEALSYGR